MPVIDLDDARAENALVVGAKAARLAHARRLGLPVLPGVVVSTEEARPALTRGRQALASGGPGRARLEVSRSQVDTDLIAALRESARRLDADRFIVRSSSYEEGDAVWGGAFASYPAVAPDEVAPAVRACWASAFTRDVIDRCASTGIRPGEVTLGVLIQSQLRPDAAGVATVHDDGSVTVIGVAGSAAGLLGGLGRSCYTTVSVDGTIRDGCELDPTLVRQVADLAQRAFAVTGYGQLEWAMAGGSPVLLQLQPVSPKANRWRAVADPALASGAALHVARLVHRFRGATGESLVLPWAIGPTDLASFGAAPAIPDRHRRSLDLRAALKRARGLAAELTATAWGLPASLATASASAALRDLRGETSGQILARVRELRPVAVEAAREALSLLTSVALQLVGTGGIGDERQLWRLSSEQLDALANGRQDAPVSSLPRLDEWDPFLCSVMAASGSPRTGVPASAGMVAGPLWRVRSLSHARRFPAGAVLLATHPLPSLAPLLWRASGLVTWSGSPGAHLVEVARSLGVPAVVSCPVEDEPGRLVAIDGDGGVVWIDRGDDGGHSR